MQKDNQFKAPSQFPPIKNIEEDGWWETYKETPCYTESQVGEMLLNIHKLVSAQHYSPCDKKIHEMVEQWLDAAEKMTKKKE